jgi:hypothetical protein
MEASLKMTVLWDVAPCCLVEVYRRFRGARCLHLQGDDERGGKLSNWLHGDIPEDSHLQDPGSNVRLFLQREH